jgi:hypothetical protein
MKRLILAFITILVFAGASQIAMGAADNLTRTARANIERDLRHELSPQVGVFDVRRSNPHGHLQRDL